MKQEMIAFYKRNHDKYFITLIRSDSRYSRAKTVKQ